MLADGSQLTAEELALLRRAQKGGTRAPKGDGMRNDVPQQSWVRTPTAAAPAYPSADAQTLSLLGQIDALLKAPPPPPRWALLRALSVLEQANS
mmetsp:Transcript_34681/g.69050  ORF Transcript_34681/g.69050 Transcript_34681/m.69050 type:complete len:94 (+) Transcript_34681:35-316(+)